MHVFIIAAVTADGFIGKDAHHLASWTSKEDKKFFVEKTKRAGVMIMGSHTYETIGKPLPGREMIVYSRTKHYEEVTVTKKSPNSLIDDLASRGYNEVAIIGGSQIYTMFLDAGVVNVLYLTVEPILFGKGVPLFTHVLERKLSLISAKQIGKGSVVLEYRIGKGKSKS